MSREENIAVVETFFNCIASSQLDRLPITPELTVQSPLTAKLSGHAALEYVKAVANGTKHIEIVQHIVEGDLVATLSENETPNGTLTIFAKFELESGRIKDVRVFYDTQQLAASS